METSFDKTMNLARELGYATRQIDTDCVMLEKGDILIEFVFNEFSPSFPFWSATEINSGRRFSSNVAVRQFISA